MNSCLQKKTFLDLVYIALFASVLAMVFRKVLLPASGIAIVVEPKQERGFAWNFSGELGVTVLMMRIANG
jgi:hypothetical protein